MEMASAPWVGSFPRRPFRLLSVASPPLKLANLWGWGETGSVWQL